MYFFIQKFQNLLLVLSLSDNLPTKIFLKCIYLTLGRIFSEILIKSVRNISPQAALELRPRGDLAVNDVRECRDGSAHGGILLYGVIGVIGCNWLPLFS